MDLAVLIVNHKDQRGIKVTFANKKFAIIGAGNGIGNGGENYDWMDNWKLHKGKIEQSASETKRPPAPRGDSLLLAQTASASRIIYWDGSEFQWYQQSD